MSLFFVCSIFIGIKLSVLSGAFVGIILYYSIYSIISGLILFKHKRFTISLLETKNIWDEKIILKTMIIPTFVTSFIDAPIYWISQVLMAKISGMETVGSLSAVIQLRNVAFIIPSFFFSTFMAFAGKVYIQQHFTFYYNKFRILIISFFFIGVSIELIL